MIKFRWHSSTNAVIAFGIETNAPNMHVVFTNIHKLISLSSDILLFTAGIL